MERKEFIRSCSWLCAGSVLAISALEGCISTRSVQGEIRGSDLVVNLSHFKQDAKKSHPFVVVHQEELQFPICVYHIRGEQYAALYLHCPHQGAELQVFGDKIQCPAHGSEFDVQGTVLNGPADSNLRTFPVKVMNNELWISLKA